MGPFLDHLLGRQGSLVVLLPDRHPDPAALYREISRQLGHSSCDVPSDFPQSFLAAPRALRSFDRRNIDNRFNLNAAT